MLKQQSSLYDIYSQTFGKVKSGTKITDKDYAFHSFTAGSTPYSAEQRLAVTIAVEDQKDDKPMKTKSELEAEIKRLLA